MANAVINFTTTDDIIQRDMPFICNFTIKSPIPSIINTENKPMGNPTVLNDTENVEWEVNIDQTQWYEIQEINQLDIDNTPNIQISGTKPLAYKYKVEIVENSLLLKDFGDNLINNIDDIIILTSNQFENWNPYTIKITVEQSDDIIVTQTKIINIYDTEPLLQMINIENNVASLTLRDNESDTIRFKISLNGTQIYPEAIGFTDYLASPITTSISLPRNNIDVGISNTLLIEGEDNYGKAFSSVNNFIGEYVGIMFCDELGNFYTTDLGVLLNYLDFGLVTAGTESDAVKVIVKNITGHDIQNLTLNLIKTSVLNGVDIQFAKTNSSFDNSLQLIWNEIVMNGDMREFYVKVIVDKMATGGGAFEVSTIATPV
jgi:hypothetical protein